MARYVDGYADGVRVSPRRQQKAALLAEALAALFPGADPTEIADLGCADGAIPVQLLLSPFGARLRHITGITLLDYNDLPEKPAHAHPRFTRVIGDLAGPLDGVDLPWGQCDAVTATAFFHYFDDPTVPLAHAARLLRPGGYLLAGMPAPWVLRLRARGVPGLLPRNRRIRCVQSLDAWAAMAATCGFTEVSRRAVQWCGTAWSAGLERALRALQCPWGSQYLVVYRQGRQETEDGSAKR